MKFPKLFGRKKDDDDDFDDDFDPDDFEVEDLDDHLEPDGDADPLAGPDPMGDSDPLADADPMAAPEPEATDDFHGADNVDDLMVGGDAAEGDGEDNPFDDLDDDDFDEDDFEDDDDEGGGRAMVFVAIGGAVLLLSILGGAGWWFFAGDDGTSPAAPAPIVENEPGRVQMAMPSAPGSLNSGGGLNADAGGAETSPDAVLEPPSATSDVAAAPTPSEPADASADQMIAPVDPTATAGGGSLNSLNSLNASNANQAGGGLVMAAVSPAALAHIPDLPTSADQSQALSNAPISGLLAEVDGIGDVPRIGSNGSTPWQAYARPADPDTTQPRVALLFEGLGLSRSASLGVINKLPPEISLVLNPYGRDLDDWVFRARLAGHELFMSLPMESEKFPLEDAGPLALDTRVQVAENQRRLDTVMASASGYVGMVTMMGSRFMKAEGQLRRILANFNDRGLMFVTGGARTRNDATFIAEELGLVRAVSEFYIDDTPRIQQIRTTLDRLESIARDNGFAVASARPYPVTIKSVMDWVATLPEKGITLVPVSAVATVPAG